MDSINKIANDRMISLLGAFRFWKTSHQEQVSARITSFLQTVYNRPSAVRSFNTLEVCRVGTDEVRHSGIIAWMLNPREGHNQGPLFLQAFLEVCNIPLPPQMDACRVKTEFTGKESTIDLIMYQRNELLIYIENKVRADEGFDQVNREFRDMVITGRGLRVPEDRQFAIFLTPQGRAPISGDASRWKTISYYELAEAVRGKMHQVTDNKVSAFLTDWMESVESWRF